MTISVAVAESDLRGLVSDLTRLAIMARVAANMEPVTQKVKARLLRTN